MNDLEAFPQRNAECSRLSPPENTTRQPQKLISSPKHEDWIVSSAFRVDNEQDVGNTLLSCLYYLQQQVLKRIAKVWIKGICPRKQAKYPYRNKRGEEEGRERAIPPWWPSQDDCTFKEPDHVDKFRMYVELLLLAALNKYRTPGAVLALLAPATVHRAVERLELREGEEAAQDSQRARMGCVPEGSCSFVHRG